MLVAAVVTVFPYIATVAETSFMTTAAMVATDAIIWKPGFYSYGDYMEDDYMAHWHEVYTFLCLMGLCKNQE